MGVLSELGCWRDPNRRPNTTIVIAATLTRSEKHPSIPLSFHNLLPLFELVQSRIPSSFIRVWLLLNRQRCHKRMLNADSPSQEPVPMYFDKMSKSRSPPRLGLLPRHPAPPLNQKNDHGWQSLAWGLRQLTQCQCRASRSNREAGYKSSTSYQSRGCQ